MAANVHRPSDDAVLSPARCRWLTGPTIPTGNFVDKRHACRPGFDIPPDQHCSKRRQRSIVNLLELLRGRRVYFIGDSITGQVTNALECALRRLPEVVGPLQPVTASREEKALAAPCARLYAAAVARLYSFKEFEESQCRALGDGRSATLAIMANATSISIAGVHVPKFDFTFYRRFGDLYQYNRPVAVRTRSGASTRAMPLPSHVALVRPLADTIVLNFGLHLGDEAAYRDAMAAALSELESFASQPGRVAVMRETSSQHFPVRGGDYHDAIRKDPKLVLAPGPNVSFRNERERHAAQQWEGPSMCLPIERDAPAHWRNAVVRELLARRRGARRVQLQPFEALTRPRWDLHAQTKYVPQLGEWKSDCTHWCYSPCFWDESFDELHEAVRRALAS